MRTAGKRRRRIRAQPPSVPSLVIVVARYVSELALARRGARQPFQVHDHAVEGARICRKLTDAGSGPQLRAGAAAAFISASSGAAGRLASSSNTRATAASAAAV